MRRWRQRGKEGRRELWVEVAAARMGRCRGTAGQKARRCSRCGGGWRRCGQARW
jgi:hypothetical protein